MAFKTRWILFGVSTVMALSLVAAFTVHGATTAQITTSQKLYSVGQTMAINGTGFTPGAYIYVTVQRPDKLTDSVLPQPLTSGSGAFKASYTPPLIPGRYTITATDGSNTAVTAVTEADAIGYNKGVYNKATTAPEDTTGNWTTGNAGSHYLENQWAFYQYEITGVGSTVPSFDVTYNHFQANTNAVFVDALADFRACVDCTDSSHTSGPSQGMLLDTDPVPPSVTTNWVLAASAISHFNRPLNSAADGSGSTVLTGSSGFCSSDNKEPIPDLVTTFPAQFHCFHVDGSTLGSLFGTTLSSGTHTITIFYAAHLAASFVWGNGTAGVGGHEGSLADCNSPYYVRPLTGPIASFEPLNPTTCTSFPVVYGTDDYDGWTAQGFGVGFATGSSRHFSLSNQSAGSSGAIDLPIPTVPQPTNTIIITKVTNPAVATGVSFPFTGSIGAPFSLDTDPGTATPNSKTFTGIAAGVTYTVTEGAAPGWTNTALSCAVTAGTDTGGTFTTNLGTSTASLTLGPTDAGVTVTCTYTNTGAGHIIVQKHTTPSGSAQSFGYTTSGSGYTNFSLKDGQSNTDGGTPPSVGLTPGTYTISEDPVTGWTLTSRTCSLTTTGSGTSTFPASGTTQPASISLGAGDTVTCVYNNSQPDANVTITPLNPVNEIGNAETFTITVTAIPNGASPVLFTSITPSVSPTAGLTSDTNTCASPTINNNVATCTLTINSSTVGSYTAHVAAVVTIGGVALTRATGDTNTGDSADAVKHYVDANITIGPPTATNEVNSAHIFNIVVTALPDGTGTPTFGAVTRTVTPTPSTLGNVICSAPVGNVENCTLTINSTTAGTFTANACTTVTMGGVPVARCTNDAKTGDVGPAVKNYIQSATTLTFNSSLSTPNTATGGIVEAGSTVTVVVTETNTGSGTIHAVSVTGSPCATWTAPGGFTGSLSAGASANFTCSFTAAAGTNSWNAQGNGTDSLNNPVSTTGETTSGSFSGVLSSLIVVKNTVGGNGIFNFAGTGAGVSPNFTITTSGGTNSATFAGIASGPKSVTETVPTGWLGNTTNLSCAQTVAGVTPSVIGTLTTGEVSAGGTITANVTLGIGATVRCVFTNGLLPTLTIVKTIEGTGTTTFTFPVTGDNPLSPTITPPPAPSTATYPPGPPTPPPGVVLNVGSNGTTSNDSISESGPPAGWVLTDFTCTGYNGGGTGAGPLDSNGVPTSWNFIANFGNNVVCTFINNNAQATRTQGFWATHTKLANDVWDGTNITFGTVLPAGATPVIGSGDEVFGPGAGCSVAFTITAIPVKAENILMGGFWAGISKTSTGTQRTSIDHARMQMLQQYEAAVLNYHLFGSIGETVLATARAAYCGTNQSAIQAQIGILGNLNQSGDTLGTTPGGSATTKTSKAQADIDAWDTPTHPVD